MAGCIQKQYRWYYSCECYTFDVSLITHFDKIFKVAGDSKPSVTEGVNKVEHVLGSSIKEVLRVEGQVRPGKEKGHEHFVSIPPIFLSFYVTSLIRSLRGSWMVSPTQLLKL